MKAAVGRGHGTGTEEGGGLVSGLAVSVVSGVYCPNGCCSNRRMQSK